jgi:hypothetical protein
MHLCFAPESGSASLDCVPDRTEYYFISEWLGQELDRSRLHGLNSHRDITETGDENDWHVDSIAGHTPLQVESIKVGQIDVKHQTTRSAHSRAREKLLCRRKHLRLPPRSLYQQLQRLAHRYVVVNYEYDWGGIQHKRCP